MQTRILSSDIIKAVNLARENPNYYVPLLEEQINSFISETEYQLKGENVVCETNDGKQAWLEAKQFLESQVPLDPFILHNGLCKAAEQQAKNLQKFDQMSHNGPDGETFLQRVTKYCHKGQGALVQIIGSDFLINDRQSAEMIVLGLIIDDGISQKGHRNALFKSGYKHIGCGVAYLSDKIAGVLILSENNLRERGPLSSIATSTSKLNNKNQQHKVQRKSAPEQKVCPSKDNEASSVSQKSLQVSSKSIKKSSTKNIEPQKAMISEKNLKKNQDSMWTFQIMENQSNNPSRVSEKTGQLVNLSSESSMAPSMASEISSSSEYKVQQKSQKQNKISSKSIRSSIRSSKRERSQKSSFSVLSGSQNNNESRQSEKAAQVDKLSSRASLKSEKQASSHKRQSQHQKEYTVSQKSRPSLKSEKQTSSHKRQSQHQKENTVSQKSRSSAKSSKIEKSKKQSCLINAAKSPSKSCQNQPMKGSYIERDNFKGSDITNNYYLGATDSNGFKKIKLKKQQSKVWEEGEFKIEQKMTQILFTDGSQENFKERTSVLLSEQ